MKLSEALKFSWDRKAVHPTDSGLILEGTDYGITIDPPNAIAAQLLQCEPVTKSWADVEPLLRDKLLKSEQWEPVDPKPAMLVLAEAYALDWGDPEDVEEAPGEVDDEQLRE